MRTQHLNTRNFSEALGELDTKYIESAINYRPRQKKTTYAEKSGRIKWASAAACLALAVIFGMGARWGGWFDGGNTVVLDNGDKIVFAKSGAVGGALSLALRVTERALTAEETRALFGDLPVTADAVFACDDADGSPQGLLGFEGNIGKIKLVISAGQISLLDTEICGTEEYTEVNGVPVTAGYFITNPNSRGQRTVIYYAAFQLGGSAVYVEHADAEARRETVKRELAAVIQRLTALKTLDLDAVRTGR